MSLKEINDCRLLQDILQETDLDDMANEDLSVLLIEELLEQHPGFVVKVDHETHDDYVEIVLQVPR